MDYLGGWGGALVCDITLEKALWCGVITWSASNVDSAASPCKQSGVPVKWLIAGTVLCGGRVSGCMAERIDYEMITDLINAYS